MFAVSGDGGWEEASIGTDGTYTLTLGPGDWSVGYDIISDSDTSRTIKMRPSRPSQGHCGFGSTVTQDFTIKTAGATITGVINDENGAQLSDQTVYVWASRPGDATYDEFETEVESSDGTFTLKVEAGGQYQVGAYLSPQLRELSYLEPSAQTADIDATGSATVTLALNKLAAENFISGTISADGSPVEAAYVYAWSDDGQYAEAKTDADGTYKILYHRFQMACRQTSPIDDDGNETVYITDTEIDADLTSATTAESKDITSHQTSRLRWSCRCL